MLNYKKYLPYLMWLFPLLFFAYQFILRLWPGLMMHQIMEQFSINATSFGILAAFYYYGYASMQIPIAILLDKFTPRYVISVCAIVCGISNLLFTYTDNFYLAVMSRFLIGSASAVGFLGVSKVISEWFGREEYAKMIGYSFTIGLMGAIYGGRPVSMLIETYSWQNVAIALSFLALGIGMVTYLSLRSPNIKKEMIAQEPNGIVAYKQIFTSPILWGIGISNFLMVGSLEGFADVWGIQYLVTAYHIDKSDAASLVSLVFFGMLFGGPCLTMFSRVIGNYAVIAFCGIGMALIFLLLMTTNVYHPVMLSVVFFVLGILCCYQVPVFALGANIVSPNVLGVTIAFLNCINMLGGSFFHTIIGKIMDCCHTGNFSSDGIKIYDLVSYQYALSVIPISACIGVLLIAISYIRTKNNVKYCSVKV